MLGLTFLSIIGLFGMWLVILGAIGERGRLWLARHPLLFLLLHLPIMFAFTSIGGEGLLFGVGNLIAGLGAQVLLMAWGHYRHGLTWTGGRTETYTSLHPKVRKTHLRHRISYGLATRLAHSSRHQERL
jgi:hypothetical protein